MNKLVKYVTTINLLNQYWKKIYLAVEFTQTKIVVYIFLQ